jgi:hypothetical protein
MNPASSSFSGAISTVEQESTNAAGMWERSSSSSAERAGGGRTCGHVVERHDRRLRAAPTVRADLVERADRVRDDELGDRDVVDRDPGAPVGPLGQGALEQHDMRSTVSHLRGHPPARHDLRERVPDRRDDPFIAAGDRTEDELPRPVLRVRPAQVATHAVSG